MICNACHAVCNDKSNSCSTRLTSIITILGILQLATAVLVESGNVFFCHSMANLVGTKGIIGNGVFSVSSAF